MHWWVKIYPKQWGKLWLINHSGGCSESLKSPGLDHAWWVSKVSFTDFIKRFRFSSLISLCISMASSTAWS